MIDIIKSFWKTMLKNPRGTIDFCGEDAKIRRNLITRVVEHFGLWGVPELETPVMELSSVLKDKYGEDSYLIYQLQPRKEESEEYALRYDLTVPFARHCGQHNLKSFSRYQIQKVYRADDPQMTRGRMCEFYQCDLDIGGSFAPMIADAEILSVFGSLLSKLGLLLKPSETSALKTVIKVNHRGLLDGIFAVCGVPNDKFRAVCSSIDKLDKQTWETVRKEIVETKGVAPEIADAVGQWVCSNRGQGLKFLQGIRFQLNDSIAKTLDTLDTLCEMLQTDANCETLEFDSILDKQTWEMVRKEVVDIKGVAPEIANAVGRWVCSNREQGLKFLEGVRLKLDDSIAKALDALGTLCEMLEKDPVFEFVEFDLSLARGLDYYTGMIFEVVVEGGNVGSICAGGRYDNLVKKLGGPDMSCVGGSLGLERAFALYSSQNSGIPEFAEFRKKALRGWNDEPKPFNAQGNCDVFVVRADKNLDTLKYAWRVANIVRNEARTATCFRMQKAPRSVGEQIVEAEELGAKFVLIVGQDEVKTLNVTIKTLANKKQEKVALDKLSAHLLAIQNAEKTQS